MLREVVNLLVEYETLLIIVLDCKLIFPSREKMNLANLRTSKSSILDKTLTKGKSDVSLTIFALVFSEIIQYSQKSSASVADLSEKIHSLGFDVGSRLLDLYVFREKNSKRETKLINMLLFIKTTLWKVRRGFYFSSELTSQI